MRNQKKTKTYNGKVCSSQYKGVSWHKTNNKGYSYITFSKKRINLGFYADEAKAAEAYNLAATNYFGKYAKLNTITSS